MGYFRDYFRRQARLDADHLNRWERRTFGHPSPLWLRDAFLVGGGIYFVAATVAYWHVSIFLSLVHGWFAIGFLAMFVEWLLKWLNWLFGELHKRLEALMRVVWHQRSRDAAQFPPRNPHDPYCREAGDYCHVWRRDDPNFFVCLKCGTRYRAR
jgi:hypothetical protein